MFSFLSYFMNTHIRQLMITFLLMGSLALGFFAAYDLLFLPESNFGSRSLLIVSILNFFVFFLESRRSKQDSIIS